MSTYTLSEMEALALLIDAGRLPSVTNSRYDAHEAGNQIIELAERIKAERATLTLEASQKAAQASERPSNA